MAEEYGSIRLEIDDITAALDAGGAGGVSASGGGNAVGGGRATGAGAPPSPEAVNATKQRVDAGGFVASQVRNLNLADPAKRLPPPYPGFGGGGGAVPGVGEFATTAAKGFASGGVAGAGEAVASGFIGGALAGTGIGLAVGLVAQVVTKAISSVVKAIIDFHRSMLEQAQKYAPFSAAALQATTAEQVAEIQRTIRSAQFRGGALALETRADTYLSNQVSGLGDRWLPTLSAGMAALTAALGGTVEALNKSVDYSAKAQDFYFSFWQSFAETLESWSQGTTFSLQMKGAVVALQQIRDLLPGKTNWKPSAQQQNMSDVLRAQARTLGGNF